ncbi:response regulator [Paraburkholderia xenovorans LB400]|nr:response regulator [Paraburkholderia xenovorans LB400]
MTQRPSHEDEGQFALWRSKCPASAVDSLSVVVAHTEIPVGESIALLLRLRGFAAVAMSSMENLELMLEHWKPRALLIDTRLCQADDFRLVRHAASDTAFSSVLIVALTNIFPEESPQDIKRIGFDGLCRRPCPVWRLADVLDGHFHP